MPSFFIDRPIFAWVIAILITLGGVLSILNAPIEAYPQIAPTQVVVGASYPGANADTIEKTVTQVIEQQLSGIDHLMYFNSTSNADGSMQITLTFESGTNPDIAAVQTQNRVSLAEPQLPSEVTRLGISVQKAAAGFLMVVALKSSDGSLDSYGLNNLLAARVLDQIQRVPGVGSTNQFGSAYAMRIWLNPDKLQGYGMSPTQVLQAVQQQNVQFASGSIGGEPAKNGQGFTAQVLAEGRFTTPEQFKAIILRTNVDGTTVTLKDVARVEFGPFQYGHSTSWGKSSLAAFGIQLLPGANALQVSKAVQAKMRELQSSFPSGVDWFIPYNSSTFVSISIHDVTITLIEAITLVFLVMLIFLQNIRATIIPTLVIPVALMGTFIGMHVLGISVNILSMFGMVLAIGIVVDDAIVVIENVERVMREEQLSAKEATRKAMSQITSAVIAITLVLAAVFIPSALQSGSVGAIYRQFALTITISMGFSAFLALSFTPALCASMLKPTHAQPNMLFRGFNRVFTWVTNTYVGHVTSAIRHAPRWMLVYGVLALLIGFMFWKLPGGFLPEEDQGYAIAIVQLPAGATISRTSEALIKAADIIKQNKAVDEVLQVAGFSFVGRGENVGLAFIRMKDYADREESVADFIKWANGKMFMEMKDAQVFVVNLPTIQGLGQFGGFDFFLQDRSGSGHDELIKASNVLLDKAGKNTAVLSGVRANTVEDAPQLKMQVDRLQAQTMGVSVSDVYSYLQLMLAPVIANQFYYQGRVLYVNLQADAPFRMGTDSLNRFFLPSTLAKSVTTASSTGPTPPAMIPLSSIVHTSWVMGSPSLNRYNGFSAIEIVGSAVAGKSSGEAMAAMQKIVTDDLPKGFGYEWSGLSLQEILSGAQAPMLYALSLLAVFLCLAALYESWSIPISVMLVVPLGVLGVLTATMLRGLSNDVYFKIGLITIIGLAAKNAILIVEFAVERQRAGKPLLEAVLEASRLRFRPILMTSMAFILGVMPLAIASGAGANSRHSIGTGVVGGMLFATFLGVAMIPIFYVVVRRLVGDRTDQTHAKLTQDNSTEKH